jgi:hypothetical protein
LACDYAKVSSGKGKPAMKCCLCEEILPSRSNAGVAEELDRLVSYLDAKPAPSCPNPACENRAWAIDDTPAAYVRYGVTGAGTPRWRCNACRIIFSVGGSPTKKQRITVPDVNSFGDSTQLPRLRTPLGRSCIRR